MPEPSDDLKKPNPDDWSSLELRDLGLLVVRVHFNSAQKYRGRGTEDESQATFLLELVTETLMKGGTPGFVGEQIRNLIIEEMRGRETKHNS